MPVLDDKSFILVPVLPEYEFCYRCESAFKTIENNAHSCGYHADGDDVDGVFQEVKLRTSNGLGEEVETKIMAWSCCGRTTEDAPVSSSFYTGINNFY